jgi:hypothetical protein
VRFNLSIYLKHMCDAGAAAVGGISGWEGGEIIKAKNVL